MFSVSILSFNSYIGIIIIIINTNICSIEIEWDGKNIKYEMKTRGGEYE